ncbi:MAG TPA: hypothetical protein VMG41_11865 [Gemmatimonadales bacterium]|nr:hypothetical protein [Gemmatimonadales bacterium]
MTRTMTAALTLAVMACGGRGEPQRATADSLQRDLQLAPADSNVAINDRPAAEPSPPPTPAPAEPKPEPAPRPRPKARESAPKPTPAAAPTPAPAPPPKPMPVTVTSGSVITATAEDSLHSRHDKAGRLFRAAISQDVTDAKGRVAIPAGSVVTFRVAQIEAAGNKSEKDGKLVLQAQSVSINGQDVPISGTADQTTVEHTLQGQGVTAGGALRVGGGAAAGAILGKVLGGKTGAIIGGVAGAAGGAAAAAHTADRDVVVHPGGKVSFTLGSDFSITP